MFDLLIHNCLIVNGVETPFKGSVATQGEKIAAILDANTDLPSRKRIDGKGQVLFPGLIDPHVHYHYGYNYRDNAQDYDTETYSALIGGVTTAIRMHRGQTPFDDHLPQEIELLEAQSRIDMTLHLTLMTDEHIKTFPQYCDQYGINSFKLYLAYKGKAGELQGILGADDGFFYDAMENIGHYPNSVACIHAENSEIAERLGSKLKLEGRDDLPAWTEARPGWTEGEAVFRSGYIAHYAKCPIYIVHLTSKEGVEAIENLRSRGYQVYAEVCCQHLTHTNETELGSIAKVNPPLRYKSDVDALWDAVERGVIDTVATDHVAHTTAKAKVPLWGVMPGNPGTATTLPAMITYGYHTGRLTLSRIASLLSKNSSDIFHLENKGKIAVGADADLVLVDLNLEKLVDPGWLGSSSDYSLYQGQTLKGWPTFVLLRGQIALENDDVKVQPGYGKFIKRN
jgi:dihydropyrimidinase